jgi:hypothetical protein
VPAERFGSMDWVVPHWGVEAVFTADMGARDHLRAAIQLLSGVVPVRITFGHTGWRQVDGRWVYLHGGGAIGPDGVVLGVEVALPDVLAHFVLPPPPEGEALRLAVVASLGLLEGLAPDAVTVPIFASVWRAVLGGADFSTYMVGETGVFKSELSALGQQHFGPGFVRLNLPGNWTSTDNANEGLAFFAKDAVLVLDDFAPGGGGRDVQSYHRRADRVFRGLGNHSARQRLWADGTLRPERPPRALVISSGEDVPSGQSLRARLFVIGVPKGVVNVARLAECQKHAADGLYAAAMSGFLRWFASRYAEVKARLPGEHAELRDKAAKAAEAGNHARTPGIVADLALGLRYFLAFAVESGAITQEQSDDLKRQTWAALLEAARAQADHVRSADPVDGFLRLLLGALSSGQAHLAARDGLGPPPDAVAWGWRREERPFAHRDGTPDSEVTYRAGGPRVGYLEGDAVYLLPDVAFAAAQELARAQNGSLPVTEDTLWRRMKERHYLVACKRGKTTVLRVVAGKKQPVHYVRRSTLLGERAPWAPRGRKSHTEQGVASKHQQAPSGPTPERNGQTGTGATIDEETACGTRGPEGPKGPVSGGVGGAGADLYDREGGRLDEQEG